MPWPSCASIRHCETSGVTFFPVCSTPSEDMDAVTDTPLSVCKTLRGSHSQILSVTVHPYLSLVVGSVRTGELYVWDVDTGLLRQTLAGHTEFVRSLRFDPSGQRLATASDDTTVRVWDLNTGACLCALVGHTRCVYAVAWNHDGSRVASGSQDTTLRVWDGMSGVLQFVSADHDASVTCLASHPFEPIFASGSKDTRVKVWKWSGALLRELVSHSDSVSSLTATDRWLLSGSVDLSVCVWSWTSDACVRVLHGFHMPLWLNALSWSDARLVVLSQDLRHMRVTMDEWDTSKADPREWVRTHSVTHGSHFPTGPAIPEGGGLICTEPVLGDNQGVRALMVCVWS